MIPVGQQHVQLGLLIRAMRLGESDKVGEMRVLPRLAGRTDGPLMGTLMGRRPRRLVTGQGG